jgi:hypothetical protein
MEGHNHKLAFKDRLNCYARPRLMAGSKFGLATLEWIYQNQTVDLGWQR